MHENDNTSLQKLADDKKLPLKYEKYKIWGYGYASVNDYERIYFVLNRVSKINVSELLRFGNRLFGTRNSGESTSSCKIYTFIGVDTEHGEHCDTNDQIKSYRCFKFALD